MKKKVLLVILFSGILAVTGCQSREEKLEDALENRKTEYNDVLCVVLSRKWDAVDQDEVYEFEKDGTGKLSGESFTYQCGFDKDNRMILQIVLDDTKEQKNYYVETDDTGYGLYLDSPGGEDIYLFQAEKELLTAEDERAAGVIGEWTDHSDNHYVLNKDRTMLVKYVSGGETEGTYSAVERKSDGELILTLVFNGNTLDFSYKLSEDGKQLLLSSTGTEVVHEWNKIK